MASFPRTVIPFEVSALEMPGPLIAKAQSGRVNIRSTQQIGRTWTEHYLINVRSVSGRGLLAAVDNFYRNGTIFTIDHRDHLTPMGAGGGSPLVNSAQLVTDPENFGAWSVITGTPTLTPGQSDPLGGTVAYLIDDNDAATSERIGETVAFTGDGTKTVALFVKQGTAATSCVRLFDATAATARLSCGITWSAGVPGLSILLGAGTLYPVELQPVASWYRILFSANSVVAANTNRIEIFGAGLEVAATTGTTYIFGANAWNSPYSMAYRSSPGAAPQTGSLLVIDGATASVSNWLRAGDLLSVGGLAPAYEVTADTSTVAGGHVQVPINPPIFTGGSPADNAVVTITGVTMNACILEPPSYPSTSGIGADYGELVCHFSESL